MAQKKNNAGENKPVSATPRKQGQRGPDKTPRVRTTDKRLPEGVAREYLAHNMKLAAFGKCDMSDLAAVENRINDYFTVCYDDDHKPTFTGLALAFGVDRNTLYRYTTGELGAKNPDVRHAIKRAATILNSQMEDYMTNGKINPVSGIFLMKNNFGYKDQTEKVIIPAAPLGEAPDQAALADKYRAQVIASDDFVDLTNDGAENNLD